VDDFRAWLAGFVAMQDLSPHAWLLRRVERAFAEARASVRIVVSAPVDLVVLGARERR
jgi:hypothetical protein